mmetsp:Transcript_5146/g.10846  ORF Transcript_5146/g.10846 Transcript_5146/m.10846 type:complete len:352 (-) Transcript_5146:1805-2860(-)
MDLVAKVSTDDVSVCIVRSSSSFSSSSSSSRSGTLGSALRVGFRPTLASLSPSPSSSLLLRLAMLLLISSRSFSISICCFLSSSSLGLKSMFLFLSPSTTSWSLSTSSSIMLLFELLLSSPEESLVFSCSGWKEPMDISSISFSLFSSISLSSSMLYLASSSSLTSTPPPPPPVSPTPETAEVTDRSLRNCAAASSALSSEEGSEGVLESTELLLDAPPESDDTKLSSLPPRALISTSSSLLVWKVLPPVVSRVSSTSVPPKDVTWLGVSRRTPMDRGRPWAGYGSAWTSWASATDLRRSTTLSTRSTRACMRCTLASTSAEGPWALLLEGVGGGGGASTPTPSLRRAASE